MSINIFRAGGASAFSRVYDFFLPAPKADSLVDKVLKLFMAIISAPFSAVKYSVGFVTSSFKKENPKTTNEQLAFAANTAVSRIKGAVESSRNFAVKNQSTIIKVVIAAAVVTGAAYAYRSYNSEIQTHPDDSRTPDNVGIFLSIVLGGALGIVKLIKNGSEAGNQVQPAAPEVGEQDALNNALKNLQTHISNVTKEVETLNTTIVNNNINLINAAAEQYTQAINEGPLNEDEFQILNNFFISISNIKIEAGKVLNNEAICKITTIRKNILNAITNHYIQKRLE